MNYADKTITLVLRGDELEQLRALINETGFDNEARLSLLYYIQSQINEQLPTHTER